jgi:REP element-mobilizing transposase RayT
MLTESERDIVLAAIRYWDGIRWNVLAAVVMPDHVHVLACPLAKGAGFWDLGELIHSVKSYSAHQISMQRIQQGHGIMGRVPGSSFSVWQDERYDRWMRDDDEIAEKWEYIVGNPVKSGLVEQAEQYCWLYQKKTGETPVPPDNDCTT